MLLDEVSRMLVPSVPIVYIFLCCIALVPTRPASTTTAVGPSQRVQDLVERMPAGTTFLIQAGVHRLESVVPKNGDSFIGEPGAILSGAIVIKSFRRQGKYWTAQRSIPQVQGPGKCQPQYPACTLPEDLFVDDEPLLRVSNLADVAGHAWYLDYTAGRLYMLDDPRGHTVELSVTRHAFYGSATDVTIRGLVVEKYANPAQSGAIHALSDPSPLSHNWVVEKNEIRLNHGAGIRLGHGTHVLRNKIDHNGQIGVGGAGRDVLVEGNEISYNNRAGYDFSWEAGGTKFAFTQSLVVRNNYVHHNEGPGLWTDGDNVNVLYERNHTAANKVAGILHEISFLAVIRDNTLEDDGFVPGHTGLWYGSGILINSSSDVEIYGNTVTNGMNGIAAVQSNRGSSRRSGRPYTVRNLFVHDNTIIQTTGIAAGLIRSDNYDDSIFTSWNNRFENNTYNLADPTGKYYQWMNAGRSKEEWQGFGNDVRGRWLTPVPAFPPVPIKKEALPE
jgi:Right handed beta helix region